MADRVPGARNMFPPWAARRRVEGAETLVPVPSVTDTVTWTRQARRWSPSWSAAGRGTQALTTCSVSWSARSTTVTGAATSTPGMSRRARTWSGVTLPWVIQASGARYR